MSDMIGNLVALLDQRIQQKKTRIRGIILADPELALFNSGETTNTWVVNVDVGDDDNFVEQALVKAGSGNSRSYARRGQAVFLERGENGRWMVIGPADRRPGTTSVIEVDQLANNAQTIQAAEGFTTASKAYDYFATINPATGNTFYGESSYRNYRVLDSSGNEVT